MRRVALQEVATINPRASKYLLLEDSPVSFVPMAAVSEMSRNIEEVEVRQYSEVSKGYTYFEEGDVIVAKITPCYENGKIALATNLPHKVAFGSTEFHVFRAGDDAYNRYIFHLLQVPKVRAAGASQMKGAAGQKRVPADYFKALQIPLPPLAEQKRIADILDAADALRAKRRESLAQLDTLLQSTFLDMFGDPVTNPKGWEVTKLGAHTSKVGSGATPKGGNESYKSEGIALIRSLNVRDGEFQWKDLARIDDVQASKLSNVIVEEEDVLLNITGASVARVCLAPNDVLPARVNQHVCIIRATDSLEPRFLEKLLLASSMKRYLLRIGESGATRQAITKSQVLNLEIPFPPLDLQRRFASIVEAGERQKARLREHLAELDTLFASLQQRAFNGEL